MIPIQILNAVKREFGDSMTAEDLGNGYYLVANKEKTDPPAPTGCPIVLHVVNGKVEFIYEPESFDYL